MEELSITGIVLSAMPFKEKDKLIHIFSVELGKVTAILKGVSSHNAKLKFASQPFCFAKFDIVKSKDFFVVKGCDVIDSFFEITSDYDNFQMSSLMLEICSNILKPNILAEGLFISLIKSLQNIVYEGVGARLVVSKFILSTLSSIGYELNFETCDNCGMKFIGDIKFDLYSGTFRCRTCSGGEIVNKQDFTTLKIINASPFEKIKTIKVRPECEQRILLLLVRDLSERLQVRFKSVEY